MRAVKPLCQVTLFLFVVLVYSNELSAKLKPNHHHHNINKDSISEIERESPYIHTPVHINFDGTLSLVFLHGHNASHGVEYTISPMVLLNGDKIKRVVKLGKQKSPIPLPSDPNDGKGYRLIRKKAYDFGLGIAPHAGFLNVVGGVAFMGHRGKSKYYDRYINNLSELKHPHHLQVPMNQEELQDWHLGDQLVFAHIGGISFHFFAGYDPFVFLGPAYRAMGEWKVHLKKVDKNKIRYDLVNEKIKSFGMEVEGTFSKIDLERFHTKEKYFSFLFDLSEPGITEIFSQAIQGNIKDAQKHCYEKQPGITTLVEGIAQSNGKRNSKMLSLPFLYGASSSKNNIVNSSFEKDLENGYTIKTNIALREKRSATFGRLSKHKLQTEFFVATHEKSTPTTDREFPDRFQDVDHEGADEIRLVDAKKNKDSPGQKKEIYHQFGGTHKWVYETDELSGSQLEDKIAKLSRRNGFESLDFSFPHEPLGYVRVELSIMFSQGFLGKILKLRDGSDMYNKLLHASLFDIRDYFSLRQNKNLCDHMSRKSCESRMLKDTEQVFGEMTDIIDKMRSTFAEHKFESFVKFYSKLGDIFTQNRFILQNIIKRFHQGIVVDFELVGEKFARYKKIIRHGRSR